MSLTGYYQLPPQHSRHYSSYQPPSQPQPFQPHHGHLYSTSSFYPQAPAPVLQHIYGLQQLLHQPPVAYAPLLISQLPLIQPPLPQQPLPQDNVVGGVSAVLDYDIDEIVKFLTLLSINIFKQHDSTTPNALESKLKNVITATRLPRSTVLLSVLYLSNKVASCSSESTTDIYTNVIMSLLLANKFNDDSTFTNKSWSHASGLEISLISKLEIEFLTCLNYDLKTIMEDSSFTVLENSFDDWCYNNKLQEQQQRASQSSSAVSYQCQTPISLQLQSPLEAEQSQFLLASSASSPPPYHGGYPTPSSYASNQLPTASTTPSVGKNFHGQFDNNVAYQAYYSSPIANPYANQPYYYYNNNTDYYMNMQQSQLQYQQPDGYYYGANNQYVPCY